MNIRRFSFAFLPAVILAFISCMNVNNSSGKDGAIRITVPGGERGLYTFNKDNATSYKVSIILDKEVIDSQTADSTGGVFTFDELEPSTYTVKAEVFDSDGIRIGSGSIEVKVVAGETAEKSILMILTNGGKIYETNYLLFHYNSSTNKYYYADSTSEITDKSFTGSNSVIAGYAECKNGAAYRYFKSNAFEDSGESGGNSDSNFATLLKTNGDRTTFSITYQDDTPIIDPFYYDETTDTLWIGHYTTTDNTLKFLKIENPSTKFFNIQNNPTFATSTGFSVSGATYMAFAIQGSDIYVAYKDNSGTSYLQRGTITSSNDSDFSISAKGTAQSTEQMGIAGTINDIAILYDGYVYALVSNVGNYATGSDDTFYTFYDCKVYSRGALLKIAGTDSGFEVEDILGWTTSARTINSVGNPESAGSSIGPLEAYIPALKENSQKFYGPRRFVAIKPKELSIADCGANFVLPNKTTGKSGKLFAHNRVINVNLYNFAIDSIVDLENIKFSNVCLSGNSMYISADYCTDTNVTEE